MESRNVAAIIQIIGWQRHAALVYCVLLWYWTSMLWSIDQFRHIKIQPKTIDLSARLWGINTEFVGLKSIVLGWILIYRNWSIDTCQNKVTADQYHVTISRTQVHSCWPLTKWIAGSCLVCWKQGRIVRKAVNANSGLKVNRIITFSSVQIFFANLFCVYGDYWNSKQNAKQYTEITKLKSKFFLFVD